MEARLYGKKLKRLQRIGLLGIAAGSAVVMTAGPAASSGAQMMRGDFQAFSAAAGTELSIGGHAQMVRTADGTTKVSIHVTGLTPDHTYNSHVHAGSCATNATGGGHYFFSGPVADGDGPAGDEIWPGPVTANGGGIADGNTFVGAVPDDTAASVVIHRSGAAPNKIACADLS